MQGGGDQYRDRALLRLFGVCDMTTIVTDGKSIAADGQSTAGDMVTNTSCQKLTRLPDGSIVGGCGELSAMRRAINCLHSPDAHPDDLTGEFTLVRLFPNGRVATYEGCLFASDLPAPVAIGSGREFAMGAMLAGKSPKDAVEIACQRDIYSGGDVVVMEPTHPPLKAVA
jgi:20S proteasome alpha/beta subunit